MKKGLILFFLALFSTQAAVASEKIRNDGNGHSYRMFTEKKSWSDAQAFCEKQGGYLVTVTSAEEQLFLHDRFFKNSRKSFWAGGSDAEVEGEWRWVTGEPFSFENWRAGEPNDMEDEDFLVLPAYFDYQWNDVPNAAKSNCFVCEWDAEGEKSEGPKVANPENSHEYQLIRQEKTWDEAVTFCENLEGYLLTVTDERENEFVSDNFLKNASFDIWLGATDRETEGEWKWVTGEKFGFADWSEGEPNEAGDEDFLEFRLNLGFKWNDVEGVFKKNPFICEWGEHARTGDELEIADEPESIFADTAADPPAVSADEPTYVYYVPLFEYSDKFLTGLGLSNSSATNRADVSITLHDPFGAVFLTETVDIPADGQRTVVLYPEQGSSGWTSIESDRPLTGVCFMIAAGAGTDNFMADIPIFRETFTELHVPHISFDIAWDTILYIANPRENEQLVRMEVLTSDGVAAASAEETIPAKGCVRHSLSSMVETDELVGGKIKIHAADGVTAFAIYTNIKTGARSFAGISPMEPF